MQKTKQDVRSETFFFIFHFLYAYISNEYFISVNFVLNFL